MNIYPEIAAAHSTLTEWRRDIHAHPELAFEENRTAAFVAEKLDEFGIEVFRGLGKTGVVGRLVKGGSDKAIGLRADMDALPMQELNGFSHKSKYDGKFHGCGHDGHTVMLLAAAKYLSKGSSFDGTVYFIFQPAEEGQGGADAMIKDGLFEQFNMDAVYGMHNAPGFSSGSFAIRTGPALAAFESFDIGITGVGGHSAMPHNCIDPIVISAQIIQSLQSIVSRNVDPVEGAVVSVTKIHAGDAYNVIPGEVKLGGSLRYFVKDVGTTMKERLQSIVNSIAEGCGAVGKVNFHKLGYPPLINDTKCTQIAKEAAESLVGEENVNADIAPLMGSEDFAYMLLEKPGCYILLGNGDDSQGVCMVHHPEYDFNDDIIPLGASYWVRLVESQLY